MRAGAFSEEMVHDLGAGQQKVPPDAGFRSGQVTSVT
jgi:hypothetical protein